MKEMKIKRVLVIVAVGLLIANVTFLNPIASAADTGGKSYTLNNHEPDNQYIEVPSGGFFDPSDDMLPNRNKMTAYGHYTGIALLPEDGGGVNGDFDLELYEDYDFEDEVVSSYRGKGKLETVVVQQATPSSNTAYFGRVLPYQGNGYSGGDIMNYVIESDSHSGSMYGSNPDTPGPLQVGQTRDSALVAGGEGGTFTGGTNDQNGEPPLLNVYSAYLYEGGDYNLTIPTTDPSFDMNLTYHIVSGNASIPQESLATGSIDENTGSEEEITYFTPSRTGWYGIVVLNHNRDNPGSQQYEILLAAEYDLSASPATRLIAPGMNTSYDVELTADGAVNPVDMDYQWLGSQPNAVNVALEKNSLYPKGDSVNETQVHVETSDSTAAGEYTLRIWGNSTDDSGITHHTDVEVVVEDQENFYINGIPDQQKVGVGTNFGFEINVSAINMFTDSVDLSVTDVSPSTSELTYSFEEDVLSSPYPNSTVLNVYITSDIVPDTYELRVKGEGGGKIHNTTVVLDVVSGLNAEIYSPLQDELVTGDHTFQADASYSGGINEVRFTFDENMSDLGTIGASYSTSSGLWERDIDTEGYPDGIATVKATAVADDGALYTTDTVNFEIKNTPPNPVIITPEDRDYVTGSSVKLEVNTSDKVNEVQYRIDDQAWNSMYHGPPTWDVDWDSNTVSDGLHTITVKATDEGGLTGESSTKVYVDNSPPSLDIVSPVDNETIQGKYKFQALVEDTVKVERVNITVFGSTTEMIYNEVTGYYERSIRTSTVSDGNYTVSMQGWDEVGHPSVNQSVSFQVANTAPTLKIHSPQPGEILNGTTGLKAEVESRFLEKVEYRVDSGGWETMSPAGSSKNYTANWTTSTVPDGEHPIRFRAVDEVGHETTITRQITVDNNPPSGSVVEPVGGQIIDQEFTFKVSASDTVGVSEVNINAFGSSYPASLNEVSGYYEYSMNTEPIGDGSYTLNATITDKNGWTYTTDAVSFKIDNTAPSVSVEEPTANSFVNGVVEINASVNDTFLSSVEARIDQGNWNDMSNISGSWSYGWDSTNYSEGEHRITVRAEDETGHTTTQSQYVTVDNQLPDGAIISPYADQILEGTYIFQISASDENGVENVILNMFGHNYTAEYNTGTGFYEYPISTSTHPDGNWTLSAKVTDTSGKELDLGPVEFRLDNTNPVVDITSPSQGKYVNGTVEINSTTADMYMDSAYYRIDTGTWRPMVSYNDSYSTAYWDTTNFTDASHQITVRAEDEIGHVSSDTATVILDNNAPSGSLISPLSGEYIEGEYTFQVSASDEVGVHKVDIQVFNSTHSMSYNPSTGFYEYTSQTSSLDDGGRNLTVYITDTSGKEVHLGPVGFHLDNTAPVVDIRTPAQGDYVTEDVEINATTADMYLSGAQYKIDTGSWRDLDIHSTYSEDIWNSTPFSEGEHQITVRAVDEIGHTSTDTLKVVVDNQAPVGSIVAPGDGEYISGTYSLLTSASDENGVNKVTLQIRNESYGINHTNQAQYNQGTGLYVYSLLTQRYPDGVYQLAATIEDNSGKVTGLPSSEFRINNDEPVLSIHDPSPSEVLSSEVNITATAEDRFLSKVQYKVDDTEWKAMAENGTEWSAVLDTSEFPDGNHELYVRARDSGGLSTQQSLDVIFDNTRPSGSIEDPTAGDYLTGNEVFMVNAQDSIGIKSVLLEFHHVENGSSIWKLGTQEMTYDPVTDYYTFQAKTYRYADGNASFNVTIIDEAGFRTNLSTVDVEVDNHAPEITFKNPRQGDHVQQTLEAEVRVTDGPYIPTVSYKVDNLTWKQMSTLDPNASINWTASIDTTQFQDGLHRLYIRGVDDAGHSSVQQIEITMDNHVPEAAILNPSSQQFIEGELLVRVDAQDEVGIDSVKVDIYSLIGGDSHSDRWSVEATYNPSSGYYEVSLDTTLEKEGGMWNVTARVIDESGKVTKTDTVEFRVDNYAPSLTIESPQNGDYVSGTIGFNVTTDDAFPGSIEYNVDDSGWVPIVVNLTTTDLAEGRHRIDIRTSDLAGHTVTQTIYVYVDNEGPSAEIASPVEDQFVQGWFSFRIAGNDEVGVKGVSIDVFNQTRKVSYDSESGYYVYEVDTRSVPDGNYSVSAVVEDYIGNVNTTDEIAFQVDNNAPTVEINRPINGEYLNGTIDMNVSVHDRFLQDVQYTVDETGYVPIGKPLNTTRLSDGEHQINVKATDLNGHITERRVTVIVDNIAPTLRMVEPLSTETISGTEKLEIYAGSEIQNMTISIPELDQGEPKAMHRMASGGSFQYALNTTELTKDEEMGGKYTAIITARDYAGHERTKRFTIAIDNAGPLINRTAPDKKAKGSIKFSTRLKDMSGVEEVKVNIDGQGWKEMINVGNDTYTYVWETERDDNGYHTYVIKAVDENGNVRTQSGQVKVDNPTDWWQVFQNNLPGITFLLIIILIIFLIYLTRNEIRRRVKPEEEEKAEAEEEKEGGFLAGISNISFGKGEEEAKEKGSEEQELKELEAEQVEEEEEEEEEQKEELEETEEAEPEPTDEESTEEPEETGEEEHEAEHTEEESEKEESKEGNLMDSVMDAELPSDKE